MVASWEDSRGGHKMLTVDGENEIEHFVVTMFVCDTLIQASCKPIYGPLHSGSAQWESVCSERPVHSSCSAQFSWAPNLVVWSLFAPPSWAAWPRALSLIAGLRVSCCTLKWAGMLAAEYKFMKTQNSKVSWDLSHLRRRQNSNRVWENSEGCIEGGHQGSLLAGLWNLSGYCEE